MDVSNNSTELCSTLKSCSSKSNLNIFNDQENLSKPEFRISDTKNLSYNIIKNEIDSNFEILSEILLNKKFSWRHDLYLDFSKKNKNKLEKSDGFSYFSQNQMIFIHQEIKGKLTSLDLSSNLINEKLLTSQSPKQLKESYIMNVILPEFLIRLVSKNLDLNLSDVDSLYFCLNI